MSVIVLQTESMCISGNNCQWHRNSGKLPTDIPINNERPENK